MSTFPLFAQRYPSVFPSSSKLKQRYKSAELAEFGNDQVAKLRDPYTKSDKYRMEDAFTKDAVARRSICSYVNFLLGRRTTTTVDINREFMNPNKQDAALRLVLNQQEIDELKTLIDRTNAKVKFHARIEAACVQAFVGGRSALMVEREQGGMPASLKVLTWSKLGQVYAQRETWEFLGVDYQDRDDPLRAEELIYFANLDYNISPDSLYYGRSMLESVLDAVETNQYILQEDLKEASRSLWASSGLVKFPPNISPQQAQEFLRGFLPGTWNSTSQQVEMQTMNLDVKIKDLIEVSAALDKRIRTGIGTPGLLVGDENVLNYATANMVMQAWRESDLNRNRTWLQDVLEPQWYNSLIQLRFPDISIEDLMIKVKMEFEDMTLDSLRDRAESLLPAVQSGYLTPEKFLAVLDFPDEIEKQAAMKREREKKRKEDLEMMRAERDNQNQQEQPPQLKQEQQPPQQQQESASLLRDLIRADLQSFVDNVQAKSAREPTPQVQEQRQPEPSVQREGRFLDQEHHQEVSIQTLSASMIEQKLEHEREQHRKQMQLLEQKQELMTSLAAKIKELESTS